jgi:putative phage-type endonuclease
MAEAQLSPQQHAARAKGVGSSDAAPAVGLSPWKTPIQLWMEKTNRVEPEDISEKDVIIFGNELEDVVARQFTRRRGMRVQQKHTPYFRRFDSGLVMVANIDRQIIGEDAGDFRGCPLECKTADKYTRQHWDEVPDHYRLQVEHQMVAANKDRAILAVVIGGNEYQDFEIERHPDMSEFLVAKESEFWQCVIDDVAPQPINAEDVVRLYPVDSGKVKIADPELVMLHEELMSIRATYKRLGDQKKKLEDALKMAIGEDAEILLEPDGQTLATWKTAKGSDYVKWEQIATELESLVPAEEYARIYAANSGTYPHGSRRFLPKELKT